MTLIFLHLGKFLMRIIYPFFKILPTQNKIIFLSRQFNEPPIDFLMLESEIIKRRPNTKIVMICERIETTPLGVIRFIQGSLRGMYHVATSQVAILDTYSPVISLLNHKSTLTVIQLWHAMGKIKKSGYSNLDSKEAVGRSSKVANIMNMHHGYDLIIAGGKAWNQFYCESFGVEEDILYNVGLPRIDYILQNRQILKQKIFDKYPKLKEKPIVLYAPTHRKKRDDGCSKFIRQFDFNKFNLIVKSHPNQKLDVETIQLFILPEFSTIECLAIADFLVTDYSGISIEAAALDVKTYYYLYDYEYYTEKNGVNIDLFKEMPGCVFTVAKPLIKALDLEYPAASFKNYQAKFLPDTIGQSTQLITDRIIENMEAR